MLACPDVNVAAICDLADFIESLPAWGRDINPLLDNVPPGNSFCMQYWCMQSVPECGTVACIAGWAYMRDNEVPDDLISQPAGRDDRVSSHAQRLLGLTDAQALELFTPQCLRGAYREITPTEAAKVLRHLAVTGEVDWLRFVSAKTLAVAAEAEAATNFSWRSIPLGREAFVAGAFTQVNEDAAVPTYRPEPVYRLSGAE